MRVAVDGRSAYAYTGSRPFAPDRRAVVFVHGAPNDHGVFALQSRYFAHHGFNVAAVDLPGHGRSEGGALTSIGALGDWLIAFVQAANLGVVSLVGHSMGSLAALDAAARYPERVEKLVLLGSAVPMKVSDALMAAAKANDHAAYDMINAWSFGAARQLGGNKLPGVWMTGNAMRLMERSGQGVLHTDLRACDTYADGIAAARAVRCPALLVIGARDAMTPPRAAQGLAAALPQKQVITLDGCGHSMMSEQPDAVLDALRAFL